MAKKTNRKIFHMVCEVCKKQNYITSSNKIEQKEKLEAKKFCKWCRKTTTHKESAKLK
ncbi:50S ribosomal protein L33 [candidate division WWE3 bacterium CG08_land_8_20_14_0_20_40_13]|uniref:Large ribosomal subunit protein bL33 n=1 Tax=candidate division WWE3 bacterium CG08_land_8_20_14_0_20_40_13 TaxID=1975084 RepID=A0A2H0XDA9_UNCKA|nr:MAG: 50S ribosomal protein L33 [candidate division WWE3 bacterium CG08_land_8_20_14_0_20_40_13]